MPDPDDDEQVLPDRSTDETAAGWGEPTDSDDDQRLLDEVPPHHTDRD